MKKLHLSFVILVAFLSIGIFVNRTNAQTSTTTISSSASSTLVTTSIDPVSPPSRTMVLSTTTVTSNAVLAVFDLKTGNASAILQAIRFNVDAVGNNWKGNQPSTLFSKLAMRVGTTTYFANEISGSTVIFRNLSINLPANSVNPLVISGVVAKNENNFFSDSSAMVTLESNNNNIVVIDQNRNHINVSGNTLRANMQYFSPRQFQKGSKASLILGDPIFTNSNNVVSLYPISFKFTLTAGDVPIYLNTTTASSSPIIFTDQMGYVVPKIMNSVASYPSVFVGDTSSYYMISPGMSRQFIYNGIVSDPMTGPGVKSIQVKAIKFGLSSSSTQAYYLSSGLENIRTTVLFNSGTTTKPVTIATTTATTTKYISTSTPYTLTSTSTSISTINPIITIKSPVGINIKAGEVITLSWYENYASSEVVITIVNSQTGAQYYSRKIGDRPVGLTTSILPKEASNIPAGRYYLTVCDTTLKSVCAKTYFYIISSSTPTYSPSYSLAPSPSPASLVCPVGYICNVIGSTNYCPSGYTCSRVTYKCPSGYVCTTYTASSVPTATPTPVTTYSPAPTVAPVTNYSPTPTYSPSSTPTPVPVSSPIATPIPVSSPISTPLPVYTSPIPVVSPGPSYSPYTSPVTSPYASPRAAIDQERLNASIWDAVKNLFTI